MHFFSDSMQFLSSNPSPSTVCNKLIIRFINELSWWSPWEPYLARNYSRDQTLKSVENSHLLQKAVGKTCEKLGKNKSPGGTMGWETSIALGWGGEKLGDNLLIASWSLRGSPVLCPMQLQSKNSEELWSWPRGGRCVMIVAWPTITRVSRDLPWEHCNWNISHLVQQERDNI